jgi:hypothetical protein
MPEAERQNAPLINDRAPASCLACLIVIIFGVIFRIQQRTRQFFFDSSAVFI